MTLDQFLSLPAAPKRGSVPYEEFLSGSLNRVAFEDDRHLIAATMDKGWSKPTYILYRWSRCRNWWRWTEGWSYANAWSESLSRLTVKLKREYEWEEKVESK